MADHERPAVNADYSSAADVSAVLTARRLRFSAGSAVRHEVSFNLRSAHALQVVGPSGSGKTTLLRVLCRLSAADGGELRLSGIPARDVPPRQWRRQVAYLAQRPVMLPGSVRDNLAAAVHMGRSGGRIDEQRVGQLFDALRLPLELLDRAAALLSGGEASRVALCRALLMQPRVLLADEPGAALDDERAAAVVELLGRWLQEQQGALVLVAHDETRWTDLSRARLALSGAQG